MERYFKIILLLVEVALDVLQKLLENRYEAENLPDFTSFLQQNQHELFHLCFTRSGLCCLCQSQNGGSCQQQSSTKKVFDKMFSDRGSSVCGKNLRTHSCKYGVDRDFKLTHVDVTLGTTLILNFYKVTLDRTEADCISDIRNVRNEISHHSVNNDICEKTYREYWGKISNAAVRLASCVSQTYRSEIEVKIEDLNKRTVCDKDTLIQRVLSWKEENDEKINALTQDMQLMHGKFDQFRRDVLQMNATRCRDENGCRSRLLDASPRRSEDNRRELVQDTEDRFQRSSTEVKQVIDEADRKYYQIYNEIEQLRLNGKDDTRDAWKYIILCYIVLRGSSEEEMNIDVLENMWNSIFGSPVAITEESKVCLFQLTPRFVEKVDSTYTAADVSVSKAVVYSCGNICPTLLSELCTADILYAFVVPDCIETDDVLINVNINTLVKQLLEKIQDTPTCVGRYLKKLQEMRGGDKCIAAFSNAWFEGELMLSADHMIGFLDGLTEEGKDFRMLEEEKAIINVISCSIDKYDNTIFHYLVVRFFESDTFETYIKYFSEENIITALPNSDGLTPLYLAAYLGRYGVVSCIVSNMQPSDLQSQLWDILTNVKDGIELLTEERSKVHIEIPRFKIGSINDFSNILDILGVGHKNTKTEESDDTSTDGAIGCGKEDDDMSKVVGDKIISLVTNIKKGLNAITKIPDLVKTIHQATKLEDK